MAHHTTAQSSGPMWTRGQAPICFWMNGLHFINALISNDSMNEFFWIKWLWSRQDQARNQMDHQHSSEPGSGLWCQEWRRKCRVSHITYLESSQPFSYWYFVIICNKREMRANDPCSGAVIHHTTSQYQREYQTNTKRFISRRRDDKRHDNLIVRNNALLLMAWFFVSENCSLRENFAMND